jgi:hypothetical protein
MSRTTIGASLAALVALAVLVLVVPADAASSQVGFGSALDRGGAAVARAGQAEAKQPITLGYYKGTTVRYFDFGAIKLKRGNKLAPIWTFTNGAAAQRNIIDTVPGQKSYTPLWQVNKVTWSAGKAPRVLKSADAVRRAAAAGEVTIVKTATVVNCPVLGFGQKRVPGFSAGRVIHYYDLGPVKVAPGNAVVPLYAVTNGVAGQHNITGDTIAPGQTAYPPLWAITKVTWKPSARPRPLTSYAAVKKAVRAGQVTLTKTTLVVNCPLV